MPVSDSDTYVERRPLPHALDLVLHFLEACGNRELGVVHRSGRESAQLRRHFQQGVRRTVRGRWLLLRRRSLAAAFLGTQPDAATENTADRRLFHLGLL